MLRHSIAVLCVLQTALAAPQFVSFKDGKVGVNFGGYHAEAGLGGLLTGNAAHGGLSASAGTPWGPQAAAGLGGSLDGRAAGGAYAGAQYSPQIGASSVIGGDVGHGGFAGAEAHSQGHVVTKTLGGGSGGDPQGPAAAAPAPAAPPVVPENAGRKELPSSIQKIKPPKKYAAVHRELMNNSIRFRHRIPNPETPAPEAVSSDAPRTPSAHAAWTEAGPTPGPATQRLDRVQGQAEEQSQSQSQTQTQSQDPGLVVVERLHRERYRQRKHRRPVNQRLRARSKVVILAPGEDASPAATVSASRQRTKHVHSKQVVKTVYAEAAAPSPPVGLEGAPLAPSAGGQQFQAGSARVHVNSGLIGSVLNIPIGILRSLQDSLSGIDINKSVTYSQTVGHHH